MFKITLYNVQAIGSAELEFDDNSIVEFTGDNSNGKSVISKVIESLTSGDILTKEDRLDLIKDHTEGASVIFEHNDTQLGVVIKENKNESFVIYIPDKNTKENVITRYFGEGGIQELVYKFGFRTYAKGSICLQLAPTFGPIPFVTTSGSINDEIVKDITIDKVADDFLNTYKSITHPIFKQTKEQLMLRRGQYEASLQNMQMYDFESYGRIYEQMKEIVFACKDYKYFRFDAIPIPPSIELIQIPHFEFRQIPILEFGPICSPFVQLTREIEELDKILNGVCPTCGKLLVEDGIH